MVVFAREKKETTCSLSFSLTHSHARLYKQSHCFLVACRRSSSSCTILFLVLGKKINLSFIKYQYLFLLQKIVSPFQKKKKLFYTWWNVHSIRFATYNWPKCNFPWPPSWLTNMNWVIKKKKKWFWVDVSNLTKHYNFHMFHIVSLLIHYKDFKIVVTT